MVDVVIAGGGPAGWSLASACARLGLSTVLVAPSTSWPATYGMWLDEVSVLPTGARYVEARARAGGRRLSRRYVVLDNASVLAGFAHPDVKLVKDRVRAATPDGVRLASGDVVRARVVIDATGAAATLTGGHRRTLTPAPPPCGQPPATARRRRSPAVSWNPGAGGHPTRPRVEQSAYGILVSPEAAAPLVAPGEAIFMDWRQPPGRADAATFLYAVPRPDGRVLLEETSLARRPGLGMAELRDRLHARLAAHGIPPDGDVERVRFAVDVPPPARFGRGAIPFGAAAGFVHPATGFSLADTFALAPLVAGAIKNAIDSDLGPARINRSVRRVMWPTTARLTYRLRRTGLATLLTLTPSQHEEFFDLFFALPDHRRRTYLSARTDLRGTAAAMAALFRAAPAHLRRKMVRR